MVEIPFIIYMSEAFQRQHKHLAQRIKRAKHLPFMTDDFIRTLLDLLGIVDTNSIESRALFNPNYNSKRARIYNNKNYDTDLIQPSE